MKTNYVLRRFLFLAALGGLFLACQEESTVRQYTEIDGRTMGTTYTIKYFSQEEYAVRDSVENWLTALNAVLSTYIPNSVISTFNTEGLVTFPVDRDGTTLTREGQYFMANIYVTNRLYQQTGGAFDPTVGPLVNLWGFGWEGRAPVYPDSSRIDSVMQMVGFENISIDRVEESIEVRRLQEGTVLDFSAIAKGYAVDMLAYYLEGMSIFDYYVEIGGEVRVAGNNPSGGPWILGINTPSEKSDAGSIFAKVELQSASMATSGNYRNFYEIDGRKVWHSINPDTGYPEANNLLSATIIHAECIYADALATACMIKGHEAALKMIENIEGAEGYFIYAENDEFVASSTSGFTKYLIEE